ncbi:MAG: hypothetical protein HY923_07715 [Elusimicrobia bacterium]|nr:hypothetical protein [Elusimicrobiota bacterium]
MRTLAGARPLLAALLFFLPGVALADTHAQKYYYEDIVSPFFVLDPARPGWFKSAREGSLPSSFPAAKPAGAFRVFILGGSIAGLLNDEVGKALSAALPSRKVEVLNCGMTGYDSAREALVEQEILEYSPDLILFLTGHNEGLAGAPIPLWVMHAQERLSRFGAYRSLVAKLRPADAAEPTRTDALADKRDKLFARTLAENIRQARARGAAVALVVPPRNYREPPELGLTFYDETFVPGWIRFLRGDYEKAREDWRAELDAPPPSGIEKSQRAAFNENFIARSEEKLGLWAESRDSFDRAAAADRSAICGPRCQDIIRDAARKEGSLLIEADKMFRTLALPRAPGLETFNDRMHWKPRFNCLMSAGIVSALRADKTLGSLPWDGSRAGAYATACPKPGGASEERDALRMLSYVLASLSAPSFHRLSPVTVFYLQTIARDRPRWFADVPGSLKRVKDLSSGMIGASPAPAAVLLPRLYWHVGEARLLEKDHAGAAAALNEALRLDPSLSQARVSLGVAEALRGDKKRALEILQDAIKRNDASSSAAATARALELGLPEQLSAGDAEHWVARAEKAAGAGKKNEALEALARAEALALQPHQLRRVGQYYLLLGEKTKYLAMSDKLVELFPEDIGFWLARAEGAFVSGRKDAGLEALARAESLKPGPSERKLIAAWRLWLDKGGAPPT